MASKAKRRWSQHVTEHSDALTLDKGVFAQSDPGAIARSLKRSADRSHRRKSSPYRSAASMLTFYINRAGRQLSATRLRKLESAKVELRRLYGKQSAEASANKKPVSKRSTSKSRVSRRNVAKRSTTKRKTLPRRKSAAARKSGARS